MAELAPSRAIRRRANFLKSVTGERTERESLPDSHPLYLRALAQLSVAVQDIAVSRGLGNLRPGDMATLLDLAAGRLRGMPPAALAGLSPSSPALFDIANTTIAPFITQDAIDRVKLQQARASLAGTGISLNDEQLARGIRSGLDAATLLAARGAAGDRYAGLGDASRMSTQEAQTIASARSLATELGMPWAANNMDLLRLGPSAIRSLHDAGVRRETFERMTSDRVGIRAETAVHFADWAKRHNLTPEQTNRLMNSTSDLHEALSAGRTPEERRRVQSDLNQSLDRFLQGPNTPEARRTLEDERMRHARTEHEREQIRQISRELADASRANVAATARRNQERQITDLGLDALNAPPQAGAGIVHTGQSQDPSRGTNAPTAVAANNTQRGNQQSLRPGVTAVAPRTA
jgi:hypothetical protein